MTIDPVPVLIAVTVLGALAAVPIAARWVRVAQREHYVPGSVSRMAQLWVQTEVISLIVFLTAAASTVAALLVPFIVLGDDVTVGHIICAALTTFAVVVLAFFPVGLPVRGRSAKLAMTSRVKRLLLVWIVVHAAIGLGLLLLIGPAGVALTLLLSAPLSDLALAITAPIEKAGSKKFVVAAQKRLAQVRPRVIAITGSYGKTSTKNYVAHLLSATFTTVASPASFNNRLGLSRAVNDKLVPGTEVFVAEMGIFGPGEIRELSTYFPPDIAAITVIGEAHLQRMGSTDVIFTAKAEITERAGTVVLPIDDPRLEALAEQCAAQGKRVVTVSCLAGGAADVVLTPGADGEASTIVIGRDAEPVPVTVSNTGHAVNVAVAAAIALAADVPVATIAARLADLPGSQHRAEVQQAPSGALVIDDTYNSNPVGALRALEGAASLAAERGGPLVVVTPGMVELGPVQAERNHTFGAAIAAAGGLLFAVARTNRAALLAGYASAAAAGAPGAIPVDLRDAAVARAVEAAGDRGVILYENDLPDHYP
ncbi:Mur ligase family protein [Microcella sp.]|uniref:Mur ligase family protein n=1 Tax=Microcella sp. TaxID=1913979 RepID=UPI00299F6161|nr:Mur ligase family protein [Microcella sp.]MDX2026376.1 Mur ligase family protein [Microcella sp.]